MTYYDIFKVSSDASVNDIKKSFIRLIKEIHPDKNSKTSNELVTELMNAYKILMGENTRTEYDKSLKIGSTFKTGYVEKNPQIFDYDKNSVVLICNQCESENIVDKKTIEEYDYYECMSCNYNVFLSD